MALKARKPLHPDRLPRTGRSPMPELDWSNPFDPRFAPTVPEHYLVPPIDPENLRAPQWPPNFEPNIPRDQPIELPPLDLERFFRPLIDPEHLREFEWPTEEPPSDPEPPVVDPDAKIGAIPKEREGESELRTMLRRAYIENLLRRSRDR